MPSSLVSADILRRGLTLGVLMTSRYRCVAKDLTLQVYRCGVLRYRCIAGGASLVTLRYRCIDVIPVGYPTLVVGRKQFLLVVVAPWAERGRRSWAVVSGPNNTPLERRVSWAIKPLLQSCRFRRDYCKVGATNPSFLLLHLLLPSPTVTWPAEGEDPGPWISVPCAACHHCS